MLSIPQDVGVGRGRKREGRVELDTFPPSEHTKQKDDKRVEHQTKKVEIIRELNELKALHVGLKDEYERENPYWSWTPNPSEIDDYGKEILRRYLRLEDIPQKVDGQLDALLSKANIRGISGGNGGGKTDVDTIDGIIKVTGELPDALKPHEKHFEWMLRRARNKFVKGRVTGIDNKQLNRVVLATWQKYTPKEYLKGGVWENSYSKEFDVLTLYRDNKPCASVEFMTNEQDPKSGQGSNLDFAKFDEEPKETIWKETIPRFRMAERLDMSIAWTPTTGLTWSTDMFHFGIFDDKEVEGNIALYKFTAVTNRHSLYKANGERSTILIDVFDGYKATAASYDEMKMRLLGEAVSLSGLVYGNLFNDKLHIVEPFFESLKDYEKGLYLTVYGIDPHTVTPTAIIFCLVDRDNNCYIDRCLSGAWDTDEIKFNFWKTVNANKYRMGWGSADKSSNSTSVAFGGRNIFREITRPTYRPVNKNANRSGSYGYNDDSVRVMLKALPALRQSEKFDGSIKAGVDEIKKRLRPPARLFIVNRAENRELINAFKTLEKDTYRNEDKGPKDRIKEGRHHMHAALRYIFQFPVNWYQAQMQVPAYEYLDEGALL